MRTRPSGIADNPRKVQQLGTDRQAAALRGVDVDVETDAIVLNPEGDNGAMSGKVLGLADSQDGQVADATHDVPDSAAVRDEHNEPLPQVLTPVGTLDDERPAVFSLVADRVVDRRPERV